MQAQQLPELVSGWNLAVHSLSELEGTVAACVSGTEDIDSIARQCGLHRVEVFAVLTSLSERGVVRWRPTRETPAPLPVMSAPALPVSDVHPTAPRDFGALHVRSAAASVDERAYEEKVDERAIARADMLERANRFDLAIIELRRAIERSPRPARFCHRLAVLLMRTHQDYEEADRLLKRAMEEEPDEPAHRARRVELLDLSTHRLGRAEAVPQGARAEVVEDAARHPHQVPLALTPQAAAKRAISSARCIVSRKPSSTTCSTYWLSKAR